MTALCCSARKGWMIDLPLYRGAEGCLAALAKKA